MSKLVGKAKDPTANGGTQNVSETLKMFREMDKKENMNTIAPGKSKFGLKGKSTDDKIESGDIDVKGKREVKVDEKSNKNPTEDKEHSESKVAENVVPGAVKGASDKFKPTSDHVTKKDSSKVTRSSSTKEIVNRYQNKLNVDTTSSGNNAATNRHSMGPVGNIRNSFQPDFMNKVSMGLMKQMKSQGSQELAISAFKSSLSSANKKTQSNMTDIEEIKSCPSKQLKSEKSIIATNEGTRVNGLSKCESNIEIQDFDVVLEQEKLTHPTITRAKPPNNLRQRRIPSRYAKMQSS